MIIQPGTTLTLETGEYSDFTYVGPFLVLRTMDQVELVGTFREQCPPVFRPNQYSHTEYNGVKGYWKQPDSDDFIAWLTKEGYIEDLEEHVSWYLGSGYSDGFKPEIQ